MGNILAAAADPHSWAKLMGLGSETTNDSINTILVDNTCPIITKLPAYIRVPLTSNTLFINMSINKVSDLTNYSGTINAVGKADWRKWLCIKNSSGNLILSIGYDNYSGNPSDFGADGNLKLYVWDGSSTPTLVNSYAIYPSRWPTKRTNYSLKTVDFTSSFYINIDTATPTNSVVRIVDQGTTYEVTGAVLHGASNMNFGQVTLCEKNTTANDNSNYAVILGSIVFADYVDYTLKAVPFKPSAFGDVNDFTGLISTVTAWIQDKNYLTTSVEVGAATSFVLTKPTLVANYAANCTKAYNVVQKIDNYMMAHYLQTGGTSISFTVALYLGTVKASNDVTVVIPANESDDKYLVKQVSNVVTNIINSSNFTGADLLNLRVRITLIGV